jgi:2-polyprenyl-3-methyl-5-hydroxy-6-metoxy-1,4-benzoquinol methylase
MVDWYRALRYGRTWYEPTGKPVASVFSEIYRRRLWAAKGQADAAPFYSGPGSDPAVSAPYIEAVQRLIEELGIASVVDLGCGDFRVGARLLRPGLAYHGIDVVEDLIKFNTEKFASANVQFSCRNIIEDELPAADLCLIR